MTPPDTLTPTSAFEAFSAATYINLATFRKSGAQVATPVWAAPMGDCLYVFSAGEAGKVKRLRNSSQAQVAICTVNGKLTGEWHAAVAELIYDETDVAGAHKALRKKYGLSMAVADFFARLTGRFAKRAYIRIRLA